MKMTPKMVLALGGLFVLFIAVAVGGILLEERQDTERMKACVAAGGDWVRDFGAVYECKGVGE